MKTITNIKMFSMINKIFCVNNIYLNSIWAGMKLEAFYWHKMTEILNANPQYILKIGNFNNGNY